MASQQEVAQLFPAMAERFVPEKAQGVDAVIQFELAGDNGGLYWLKINDGSCTAGEGQIDNARATFKAAADDWYNIATGQSNPMQAFMTGKLKVAGDMGLAMKMQQMFAM
jgi:putative sterol carrier protein